MEPPRKRRSFSWLFRWNTWRKLLLIVTGAVTVVALFHAEENWRGKRAWDNYKREVEARGESFDFAKYVPPPVPDDQNFAMTPFLAPLFDFVPGTQRQRDTNAVERTHRAAEMPNEIQTSFNKGGWPEASYLDLIRIANELLATNHSAPPRFSRGETREAAQAILEKLKPVEPVLEELRRASQRPYSRFNIDYEWEPEFGILLPQLHTVTAMCSKLELRACSELALAQPAPASHDIRLMFTLVNSLRDEPFLITELVRFACLTKTLQPMWEGLSRHQWTDEELVDFSQELRTLDFLDDGVHALRTESHCADSYFGDLRSSRNPFRAVNDIANGSDNSSEGGLATAIGTVIPRGWIYLEQLNYHRLVDFELNDVITPKGIDPEVADRKDAEVHRELVSSGVVGSILGHRIISRALLPSLNGFERKMAQAQTWVNLADIGCALERYRLVHGQFPEALDALAPQFLAAVPRDVIMDQPLKYRLLENGQFILYSVGWNKTDDGGVIVKASEELTHGDWVWEYPAASPPEQAITSPLWPGRFESAAAAPRGQRR
jgi:hypothetical protein